ncbi:MAG: hypothetical protein BWK79_08655 [Beggiatoa sp. IS2]|nr:MAG: hypothetical protein BWK79_08655 [Beggiatoa sp. IS2]
MTQSNPSQAANRRQYPRVRVAVDCKFVDSPSEEYLTVIDISLGGMRLHTNHTVKVNDKIRLELILLDNTSIMCTARIAWLKPLPLWAPVKHDVGFQFLDLSDDDLRHLANILQVSPTLVNAAIGGHFTFKLLSDTMKDRLLIEQINLSGFVPLRLAYAG